MTAATHRRLWAVLGIAAMIAAVAGFLVRGDGDGADSATAGGKPTLTIGGVPAPTDRDDELIEWAELVLAGRCMVAKGYSFTVDWVVDHSIPDFATMPYGTTDLGLADKVGYGIGPEYLRAGSGIKRDPNRDYVETLSKQEQQAYTVAMFGAGNDKIEVDNGHGKTSTNRDGCLSAARHELYGDLDRWVSLDVWASNLDLDIVPRVEADPRYVAALSAWRDCMAAAGRPAQTPWASRAAIMQLYQVETYDQAWATERQTAVADARCTGSSHLLAVAETVHGEIVATLEKQRADDVRDYLALKASAARTARALLTEMTRT